MPANPFSWAAYTPPTMTAGSANYDFYKPSDSKLTYDVAGALATGDPFAQTRRAMKFDGALTREQMGNQTGFLNDQMGVGFGGVQSTLEQMAQYGGAFGDKSSPVYSPQSQNGYGSGWGGSNPFKIGSF